MATVSDLRRIALALPGVTEDGSGRQRSFSVTQKGKSKGIAWEWMERVDPKKARVPNAGIYAVRVPNLVAKEMWLDLGRETGKFFTEPHYNNYPAVLVRLELSTTEELAELLEAAVESFSN